MRGRQGNAWSLRCGSRRFKNNKDYLVFGLFSGKQGKNASTEKEEQQSQEQKKRKVHEAVYQSVIFVLVVKFFYSFHHLNSLN